MTLPPLRKITEISETLQPNAIKDAIRSFVAESWDDSVPFDREGYYNQTLNQIINIVILKNTPGATVWIAEDADGSIAAWAITSVSVDIDNTLTFWGRDAWISKRFRRNPAVVKEWFGTLRAEARKLGCKHFVIPSSRNVAAYCRFLGGGFHPYISLIKEDI